MSDSLVGIVVDPDGLRVVEISKQRSKAAQVRLAASHPLPPHTIEDGRILRPQVIVSVLKRVWKTHDFKSRRVVFALDGRQTLIRRNSQPRADALQLRRTAGYDIEDFLSYPIGEAVFDLSEVRGGSQHREDWTSVLVVSVHDVLRQQLMDIATDAGLRPTGVVAGAECLSLHRLMSSPVEEALASQGQSDELTVVVHVGDVETDIAIVDTDGLVFGRTLASGVGETAAALADELESQLEGMEGHRSRVQVGTEVDRRESVLKAGVLNVVEGVRRTLEYYSSDLDVRQVQSILVTGSHSGTMGLVPALRSALNVPVSHGSAPSGWRDSFGDHAGFEMAIGAALTASAQARPLRRFCLVPSRVAERSSGRRHLLVGAAMVLGVSGVLGVRYLELRDELESAESALADAQGISQNLAEESQAFEGLATQANAVENSVANIDRLLNDEIDFSLALQEVASLLPSASQLKSIQMRRSLGDEESMGYSDGEMVGLVTFTGTSETLADVGDLVSQVSDATLIDGVWLTRSAYAPAGSDDEVVATFSIGAVLSEQSLTGNRFVQASSSGVGGAGS